MRICIHIHTESLEGYGCHWGIGLQGGGNVLLTLCTSALLEFILTSMCCFSVHAIIFFLRIVQRLRKANFTATVQKIAVICKKSSPGWGRPELHLARTFRTQTNKIDSCLCELSWGTGQHESSWKCGVIQAFLASYRWNSSEDLKFGEGNWHIPLHFMAVPDWNATSQLPFWWTCNLHTIHTSLFIIHHFHVRSVIFCILLPDPN